MSLPPNDVSPAELWAELSKMPRPHRAVDFPRMHPTTGEPIGQVSMAVLFQGEAIDAAAQAEKFTRATLKAALDENVRKDEASAGYDDIYNNASVDEVLFRAVRRLDDVNSLFFPSPASVRQKLAQDEVAVLFREYLIVKAELGPMVSEMGPGEMKAWVEKLVEGGSAFPLARLSSDGLNDLVKAMALQLHAFWTATSSSGWPPGSSLTPPSDPSTPPLPPELPSEASPPPTATTTSSASEPSLPEASAVDSAASPSTSPSVATDAPSAPEPPTKAPDK
jgi:hypothetical protein